MTQFTVYKNKNPRSKTTYPLLLDAQADLLDDLQTRLVIPLTKAPTLTKKPIARLTPPITVAGEHYLLMTPQLAGILRSELGAAVGNVADQRSAILAAVDLLITGA
ncbi:CcdB family protein [Peristeroidobacter soli]|jgi:toxin CcdB|uniref:CcdB family protein n=1 Tax=Peristeroidobacter soli TaxID=2497877 RepID=UPI00101B88AC|nr:CcdB family protein [Peristeroidobacter soli]